MLDPLFDAKDIAFKDKTMQQSEQDINEENNDSDSAPSEEGAINSQRVIELYRRQRSLHESDYDWLFNYQMISLILVFFTTLSGRLLFCAFRAST